MLQSTDPKRLSNRGTHESHCEGEVEQTSDITGGSWQSECGDMWEQEGSFEGGWRESTGKDNWNQGHL